MTFIKIKLINKVYYLGSESLNRFSFIKTSFKMIIMFCSFLLYKLFNIKKSNFNGPTTKTMLFRFVYRTTDSSAETAFKLYIMSPGQGFNTYILYVPSPEAYSGITSRGGGCSVRGVCTPPLFL